jgi:hypothetical protein
LGQPWTSIAPENGSILHADSHPVMLAALEGLAGEEEGIIEKEIFR